MKSHLAMIIGISLLAGCSDPNLRKIKEIRSLTSDPQFDGYKASFEALTGATTSGITINVADAFREPPAIEQTVGECYVYDYDERRIANVQEALQGSIMKMDSDVIRTIEVLSWFWNAAGPIERKVLIYHELGHCAMGLEHDERLMLAPSVYRDSRRLSADTPFDPRWIPSLTPSPNDEDSENGWYLYWSKRPYSIMSSFTSVGETDSDIVEHFEALLAGNDSPFDITHDAYDEMNEENPDGLPLIKIRDLRHMRGY